MSYHNDFFKKNGPQLLAVQKAMEEQQRVQERIEKLKNPVLRVQAEIESAFGPNASVLLMMVQKEIEAQERLEALMQPNLLRTQVEAAMEASAMRDLLRPVPPPEADNEYIAAMHQATENSKAAIRELVAAEVKRQLESRDNEPDSSKSE